MPEGVMQDIAQISLYLAKEEADFASVINDDFAITKKPAFKERLFNVGDASCKFMYFETFSSKENPPWLEFINEQIPEGKEIAFEANTKSANGVLLIALDGRVLIATFGRSAPSALIRKRLETDFGIKTAMNMCGNEEIRQTRSQSTSITTTHIDRQVSKPSDAFVFGLSEAEDLKYISAHMKGDKNVTLQGRDSLTVKIIGDDKLTWASLIRRCKTYIERYGSKDYVELFPNYKNFKPATDDENLKLDAILLDTIRKKDFSKLHIGVPEFMPEKDYNYSFTNYPTKENKIYGFLDIALLADAVDLDTVDMAALLRRRIYAYMPIDGEIRVDQSWALYECLVFESELEKADGTKGYFILSDGRWLEVDRDFYNTIENFVSEKLTEFQCEDIYLGIDISHDATKTNRESVFNSKAIDIRPSAILFDQAKLQIGTGRKDKEFCDILDLPDEGLMRIINVKKYKDASSVNYLFSQARFYSEAFLTDDRFLSDIRDHIQKAPSALKHRYLEYIKPSVEQNHGQDFRLCLWLLYNKNEKAPSKADIPLISQYEIKLMHDHLQKWCKIKEIVLRFVPVKTTNYETGIKLPKKEKGK